MVSHRTVEQPDLAAIAELVHTGIVAPWDRKGPHAGDSIETDVDHAESPLEILDVIDGFLMRLCCQQGFGHPIASRYLADVIYVEQAVDVLLHDYRFTRAVVDVST